MIVNAIYTAVSMIIHSNYKHGTQDHHRIEPKSGYIYKVICGEGTMTALALRPGLMRF